MMRIRNEHEPVLENIDEGVLAIEHDYAQADPIDSIARYRQGRTELVAFMRSLPEDELARIGHRPTIGRVTIETLAILVVGHDGYHLQQVAQWTASRA
jgi:hypothetical protein